MLSFLHPKGKGEMAHFIGCCHPKKETPANAFPHSKLSMCLCLVFLYYEKWLFFVSVIQLYFSFFYPKSGKELLWQYYYPQYKCEQLQVNTQNIEI